MYLLISASVHMKRLIHEVQLFRLYILLYVLLFCVFYTFSDETIESSSINESLRDNENKISPIELLRKNGTIEMLSQ